MARKSRQVAQPLARMRPEPPSSLFDTTRWLPRIIPADGVGDWVQATFLRDGAPLLNPDHAHLHDADIAYLWAGIPNERKMRRIVGECEQIMFRDSGWQRGRKEQQLEEWFGRVPEFLITFDAEYARQASDVDWCALVEHELYHIGQRLDEYQQPMFTREGLPKLGIRGHDVEEFVGVVRRYGVGAGAGDTAQLVAAANQRPTIGSAAIAHACGTCVLRAA